MKRILFVLRKSPVVEPLGIMYLSAALKARGHDVRAAWGLAAIHNVREWDPHYVCYSVMTGDHQWFKNYDSLIRNKRDFISVFGGPHPTFFPQDFDPKSSIVFRGEGEEALPDLVDKGVDHGVYGPFVVENLDKLHWPDLSLFQTKIRHFMASRGCAFNCSYCFNAKWKKLTKCNRIRYRSPAKLVEEIKFANPQFVYFQDDNFGFDPVWLNEFCKHYSDTGIPYHCHIHPILAEQSRVWKLILSGCHSVHTALETANDKVRKKLLGRSVTIEQVTEAVKWFHYHGVHVMLQNMIGLPDTELQDDIETLKLNIILQPAYAWCSIYQPYPGTALGDYCFKKGLWDGDYSKINSSFFDESPIYRDTARAEPLKVLQKEFAIAVKHKYIPGDLTYTGFMQRAYDRCRAEGDKILYRGYV